MWSCRPKPCLLRDPFLSQINIYRLCAYPSRQLSKDPTAFPFGHSLIFSAAVREAYQSPLCEPSLPEQRSLLGRRGRRTLAGACPPELQLPRNPVTLLARSSSMYRQ